MGALAALLVVWLGNWGVAIDAVIALAIILGLFMRSRRNAVTHANAMSDVAESGRAIELPDTPPPTRRQQRIEQAKAEARARAEAREKVKAQAKKDAQAKAKKKAQAKAGAGSSKSATSSTKSGTDRNGESE